MHIEYFRTAAADIKNSPGWLGKLCLLTLLLAIPVFGIIVVTGYLYGWARDIAWGTKNPLPPRIFGNEDGKLYERGLYICVFMFVCALIPQIFTFAAMLVSGTGVAVTSAAGSSANYGAMAGMGVVLSLLSLAGSVVALAIMLYQWVGSMRISIYGRISAGFQVNKVLAMIKKDPKGIFKIFGMSLLVGFLIGLVISVLFAVAALVAIVPLAGMLSEIDGGSAGSAFGALAVMMGVLLVLLYLSMVLCMWLMALIARALGYWTSQFNVPAWQGQEAPMPFELEQASYPAQHPQQ